MSTIQIFERFPTNESCVEHLEKARWRGRPQCPYCRSERTTRNSGRHYCYTCTTSFSVTVGTIFHHTHLSLQKWFLAISLILNARKGISAAQLSRVIQINKNTACRISMQIRKAMSQKTDRDLLFSVIEMGDTYARGKQAKGSGGEELTSVPSIQHKSN